ncbi:hypothetical protein Tco_0235681, partial [Tanacetum coccineum]
MTGRITGKGTIRTPTLDFENVYYVKELQQFNLFSISQICDKKNRVLFTDTDCLVLSKDFKLPDDSMVLLRVPRKYNLYTINLNNLYTINLDAIMRMKLKKENSYTDAEDEGIFDSVCSRSMTGNMERLDDFQEFQGG